MTTLIALALVAQTGRVLDQGMFITRLNGKEIGREGFRILDNGRSSSIISSVDGDTLTVIAKTEFVTTDGGLQSALVNIVDKSSYRLQVTGGKVVYADGKTLSTDGKPIYALESYAWHNYTQIFRAYPVAGGSQSYQVIMPSERKKTTLVLERVGERIEEGRSVYDWVGTIEGVEHTYTSDTEGRLLSLSIVEKGITVTRKPITAPPIAPVVPSPAGTDDPAKIKPNRDKYNEREGRIFGTAAVLLAGTLTTPKDKLKHPAVVLFSDSTPSDRNWNSPPEVTGSPAAQLADRLAAGGYVVFRFDDRGMGESSGVKNTATLSNKLSDARSIVAFVKSQPEVDPFKVVVCGLGEGAYIANTLCAEDPTLAGSISLNGLAQSVDIVMLNALSKMTADEGLPAVDRERAAKSIGRIQTLIDRAKQGHVGIVDGINLEWLRESLAVNPLEPIARLRTPLLIVHGKADYEVLVENATMLTNAAVDNEVDVVTELIANMNHNLMQSPYGNPDYDPNNPTAVVPLVWDSMILWLDAKVKNR